MADVLSLAIRSTLFLVVPCAAGFLVLARPVVEVMLERGVVTARSTDLVVGILSFLVLGLVQFSLFQVLMRASYAMKDARSPFVVNSIVIGVNIALNVTMFNWIGPEGLAAGHALAYTLAIVLQGRVVARELPGFDLARIRRSTAKVLLAAGVMAALVGGLARLLEDLTGAAQIAAVTGLVAVGAVSYLWFAALLRVEEMQFVRDLVGDRFGRSGAR
jgi:putative peptidoglycan lipid II flippase